ncbi:hypothetical protein AGMMS49574_05650 [Bacteroidia bacterium]|nr:hypothetical protein AGMMS49574_05650 [Bacteroidia bacterium]GHV05692.1 hypothetical protein FACS189416_5610 [Bacteroidia bacterium]
MLSDWKMVILSRYDGEYPPATAIRKSSEDIAFDLSGMGEFIADEVSYYMAVYGYQIDFDDGKPVWLLQPLEMDKSLTN